MKGLRKVAVFGLAKSGTTALLYLLRDSWPGEHRLRVLFEPREWDPAGRDLTQDFLVKVLIGPPGYADYPSFSEFSPKILIVRDPRDALVSALLYNLFEFPAETHSRELEAYLELVERKVVDPQSVRLKDIAGAMLRGMFPEKAGDPAYPNDGRIQRLILDGCDWQTAFLKQVSDVVVVRYEAFIERDLGELETRLQFPLRGSGEVEAEHRRVARSKGKGEWRKWFTEEDHTFFSHPISGYLETWGYCPDYQPDTRGIDRRTSIDYLHQLLQKRKERIDRQRGIQESG